MSRSRNGKIVHRTGHGPPGRVEITAELSHHDGPVPSAEELARYDRVLPGSAERFFQMAERAQRHHEAVDLKLVESAVAGSSAAWRFRGRGQYAITIVVVTAVVGATAAAALGAPWQAVTAIGGGPMFTAAISALASGWFQKVQKKELEAEEAAVREADRQLGDGKTTKQ